MHKTTALQNYGYYGYKTEKKWNMLIFNDPARKNIVYLNVIHTCW